MNYPIHILIDFTLHDHTKNNLNKLKDNLTTYRHDIYERQFAYNNRIQNLEKLAQTID